MQAKGAFYSAKRSKNLGGEWNGILRLTAVGLKTSSEQTRSINEFST